MMDFERFHQFLRKAGQLSARFFAMLCFCAGHTVNVWACTLYGRVETCLTAESAGGTRQSVEFGRKRLPFPFLFSFLLRSFLLCDTTYMRNEAEIQPTWSLLTASGFRWFKTVDAAARRQEGRVWELYCFCKTTPATLDTERPPAGRNRLRNRILDNKKRFWTLRAGLFFWTLSDGSGRKGSGQIDTSSRYDPFLVRKTAI